MMDDVIEFIREHDVKSVLDIGANVGNFSRVIKRYFPETDILMFEANPFCDNMLRQTGIPYEIACLSDTEKEVKFYIQDNNMIGTGASYYLEKTHYYSMENFIRTKTQTLDNILKTKYDDKSFEFIKLDTQGSEVDIMMGGLDALSKAKYVLIEMSLVEYNHGAPLTNDVVLFMKKNGFSPVSLVEDHVIDGVLVQEDWIFAR